MHKFAASIVLFVAAMAFCSTAAAAQNCPVDVAEIDRAGGYVAAVEALVKAAPDCARAYKMLKACQLGSSGDNTLSDIVQSKCEPLFKAKAGAATKQAYKKALERCDRLAEKNEGTMYQSFAAVCRAGEARRFAQKFESRR
jgi:hypothetical protein